LPTAFEFQPEKIFIRGFSAWQDVPAAERWGFTKDDGEQYWSIVLSNLERDMAAYIDRIYVGRRFRNSQIIVFLTPGLGTALVHATARRLSEVCLANPPPDFMRGPGFKKVFAQADQPPLKKLSVTNFCGWASRL
jgi:hypothetical protein